MLDVRVGSVRLEAQGMLESNGKGDNEVHGADLFEEELAGILVSWFSSMNPKDSAKGLGSVDELTPVSTTFSVTLIGSRRPERQTQTDNETENSEKNRVDTNGVDLFVNDSDSS